MGRPDYSEKTFYIFLISLQPSHSYTHRVRNGLTIAANLNTLFLATISCGNERPGPQPPGSQGKPSEHNPRRQGRRLHVAQALVAGLHVGSICMSGRFACRVELHVGSGCMSGRVACRVELHVGSQPGNSSGGMRGVGSKW
jgi:hypothetical protein